MNGVVWHCLLRARLLTLARSGGEVGSAAATATNTKMLVFMVGFGGGGRQREV